MTALQVFVMVGTLIVQAAAVGMLFAWRIKNDPTLNSNTPIANGSDGITSALLWLAVVCIGGGLVTTGCLAYGAFSEVA